MADATQLITSSINSVLYFRLSGSLSPQRSPLSTQLVISKFAKVELYAEHLQLILPPWADPLITAVPLEWSDLAAVGQRRSIGLRRNPEHCWISSARIESGYSSHTVVQGKKKKTTHQNQKRKDQPTVLKGLHSSCRPLCMNTFTHHTFVLLYATEYILVNDQWLYTALTLGG